MSLLTNLRTETYSEGMNMDDRKELYEGIAENYQLMQDVLNRENSFLDSLTEIVERLEGNPDEDAVNDFNEFYNMAMEVEPTMLEPHKRDFVTAVYTTFHEDAKKERLDTNLKQAGLHAIGFGCGVILGRKPEKKWKYAGVVVKALNSASLGLLGYKHFTYVLGEKQSRELVQDHVDELYSLATAMDVEVMQLSMHDTMTRIEETLDDIGEKYGFDEELPELEEGEHWEIIVEEVPDEVPDYEVSDKDLDAYSLDFVSDELEDNPAEEE